MKPLAALALAFACAAALGEGNETMLDRTFHSKEEAERRGFTLAHMESVDEVTGYLVDVVGDEDYGQSRWFDEGGCLDAKMLPDKNQE